MAGILTYGAGIGNALRNQEDLDLKRKMDADAWALKLRQQDEAERSARSNEDYRNKSLEENMLLRKLTQEGLNQNRADQLAERQRSRVLKTVDLRPIGAPVTDAEFDQEREAGVPEAMYDIKREGGYLTGEEQGPLMVRSITSKGTPDQLMALQRIKDAEANAQAAQEDRDLARQQQLYMKQLTEGRLNAWGPPTVVIADPNDPTVSRIVGRDVVNRQGGATAPSPSPIQQQAIGNEVSSTQLERLKGMFDAGAKDMVGPAEGRLRSIGQKIPGVPVNTDYANFEAETSAFRNSVIKAITGAQMSEVEAQRIRQQIPEISDKPEVWLAKYAQTQANLKDLQNRVKARTAGGATAAPGQKRQVGRFIIEE